MFHVSNLIIKDKAGLLNLASELQNVSKACKIMGVSRATFFRYQELIETAGLEGLINRERRHLIIRAVLAKAPNKVSSVMQ